MLLSRQDATIRSASAAHGASAGQTTPSPKKAAPPLCQSWGSYWRIIMNSLAGSMVPVARSGATLLPLGVAGILALCGAGQYRMWRGTNRNGISR